MDIEGLVRSGIVAMGKRREAVEKIVGFADREPVVAARGLVVLAQVERHRRKLELQERFAFTVERSEEKYRCRFADSRRIPRSMEEKAVWLDSFVLLVGYERALECMWTAAQYHSVLRGQYRAMARAFLDVYERTPSMYNAFAADGPDDVTRSYAAAMAAAWVKVYLWSYGGSKVGQVLSKEGWEHELVVAAQTAWGWHVESEKDLPVKRGTRFRDAEGLKDSLGRRARVPGTDPDFINLVSQALEGKTFDERRTSSKPEETQIAAFIDRETALRLAREKGLTPREGEILILCAEKPNLTSAEIADAIGSSPGSVRVLKSRLFKKFKVA